METDKLLTYIEQNIKEDISLVDLAEVVHYSPRQIYYMIKEATGMPVMSYIRYRRLIKAAAEIADKGYRERRTVHGHSGIRILFPDRNDDNEGSRRKGDGERRVHAL